MAKLKNDSSNIELWTINWVSDCGK